MERRGRVGFLPGFGVIQGTVMCVLLCHAPVQSSLHPLSDSKMDSAPIDNQGTHMSHSSSEAGELGGVPEF